MPHHLKHFLCIHLLLFSIFFVVVFFFIRFIRCPEIGKQSNYTHGHARERASDTCCLRQWKWYGRDDKNHFEFDEKMTYWVYNSCPLWYFASIKNRISNLQSKRIYIIWKMDLREKGQHFNKETEMRGDEM